MQSGMVVALKVCDKTSSHEEKRAFLEEAERMSHISQPGHKNVGFCCILTRVLGYGIVTHTWYGICLNFVQWKTVDILYLYLPDPPLCHMNVGSCVLSLSQRGQVVHLIGVCVLSEPCIIAMEFCHNGWIFNLFCCRLSISLLLFLLLLLFILLWFSHFALLTLH